MRGREREEGWCYGPKPPVVMMMARVVVFGQRVWGGDEVVVITLL